MPEHRVIKLISRMLIPFIVLFGLYIQLHGDYSPGGGFQAGVIIAASFILYSLVFGLDELKEFLPFSLVRFGCAFGVLLYGMVGVFSLLFRGNFLNYSVLLPNPIHGQHLGIIVIELGVGITVFSVMLMLFYTFAERTR